MTTEETWFYLGADDEQCGPVSRAQLLELAKQGQVRGDALLWRPGFDGWKTFRDVEELKATDAKATAAKSPATKSPDAKAPAPKAAAAKAATPTATPTTAALKQLLGLAQHTIAKIPPKVAAPKSATPAGKAPARKDRTPVAVGAVFAVVAVATVAAMYRYSNPAPRGAQPTDPVLTQAEPPPVIEAPPAPAVVRVKNPFDKSEVFEFPPGTRVADAHDKVADILMKRASERQKQFDARTRTSRRR